MSVFLLKTLERRLSALEGAFCGVNAGPAMKLGSVSMACSLMEGSLIEDSLIEGSLIVGVAERGKVVLC